MRNFILPSRSFLFAPDTALAAPEAETEERYEENQDGDSGGEEIQDSNADPGDEDDSTDTEPSESAVDEALEALLYRAEQAGFDPDELREFSPKAINKMIDLRLERDQNAAAKDGPSGEEPANPFALEEFVDALEDKEDSIDPRIKTYLEKLSAHVNASLKKLSGATVNAFGTVNHEWLQRDFDTLLTLAASDPKYGEHVKRLYGSGESRRMDNRSTEFKRRNQTFTRYLKEAGGFKGKDPMKLFMRTMLADYADDIISATRQGATDAVRSEAQEARKAAPERPTQRAGPVDHKKATLAAAGKLGKALRSLSR